MCWLRGQRSGSGGHLGGRGSNPGESVAYLYYAHLGSVEATSDGNGQNVTQYSYDAWGKARPTTGTSAYQDPAPGSFYSPTPAGQEEGFAGHDNLRDRGRVLTLYILLLDQ